MVREDAMQTGEQLRKDIYKWRAKKTSIAVHGYDLVLNVFNNSVPLLFFKLEIFDQSRFTYI